MPKKYNNIPTIEDAVRHSRDVIRNAHNTDPYLIGIDKTLPTLEKAEQHEQNVIRNARNTDPYLIGIDTYNKFPEFQSADYTTIDELNHYNRINQAIDDPFIKNTINKPSFNSPSNPFRFEGGYYPIFNNSTKPSGYGGLLNLIMNWFKKK